MNIVLIVQLIILYVLWRTGVLRRLINGVTARLERVANGKPGSFQRIARSMVRASEYLELTRGRAISPGGLWVNYAIFMLIAPTFIAGGGPDAIRFYLVFVLVLAVVGVIIATMLGGASYIRAAQRNMARSLPEAFGIMGNEIAAGHSIEVAVQRVALQFGKPLNQEFADALVKMTASGGLISIDQALAEIAQNPLYQSDELDQAALTISVVRPLGGDLGSLLTDLARLLHQREATEREIRTQLAPGRQAATSLVAIIGGLFLLLTVFPLFSSLLWGTYQGRTVLIIAFLLIGLSIYWIIQINSYDL